jgi:hypothetical protein
MASTASAFGPALAVMVVPSSGSSAMSIRGRCPAPADLLADIEHRRLVALAFADHDGAVHSSCVQRSAHRFDGGMVGRLLIAAPDQLRGRNRRRFGDPHHFQNEHAIERAACRHHLKGLCHPSTPPSSPASRTCSTGPM